MGKTGSVGRVLGTRAASPLSFWVGLEPGQVLQLDDVVVTTREIPGHGRVLIAGVVELADDVTAVLPALAGVDYKDPRAPQNLIPIGGLEHLLRHRLGDPRMLYRALASAAR